MTPSTSAESLPAPTSAPATLEACPRTDAAACAHQCERGSLESCVRLSYLYEHGLRGVARDGERAQALLERACAGDYAPGCTQLGYLHASWEDDENMIRANDRAVVLHRAACAAGSGRDCADLGQLYSRGVPDLDHQQAAIEMYHKGCDLGYGGGCDLLGKAYLDGTPPLQHDRAVARGFFDRGCDLGHMSACFHLARTIDDRTRARTLIERACDGGYTLACETLAGFYLSGPHKDEARALELLQDACDQGNDRACAKRLQAGRRARMCPIPRGGLLLRPSLRAGHRRAGPLQVGRPGEPAYSTSAGRRLAGR